MLFGTPVTMAFKAWLIQESENRRLLIAVTIVTVLQFSVFKFLYPFPNFMPPDSNSYLEAAFNNQVINMWPVGYSMFVRLVSSFTSSHFVLVTIQYLLFLFSLIYFLFTIRYLLSPGKWVFRILLLLSILNPLLLHTSNFISSDSLFITLSLIWFTQLLWIFHRPNRNLFVLHSVVLLLAFMVRYYALYYPLISIVCILSLRLALKQKLVGVSLVVLLLTTFIVRTIFQYQKSIGTSQFSAFGGWQLAANALYGYSNSRKTSPETVPPKFRELHTLVNKHMDSIQQLLIRPDFDIGVYYLWDEKAPLKKYMHHTWWNDDSTRFFKRWASMGPLYAEYGSYLISRYPVNYMKYFLWPNLVKFYAPPPGFLGEYNIGKENVEPIVVSWFRWKNNKITSYLNKKTIAISHTFQILAGITNLVFVLGFICFLVVCGFKNSSSMNRKVIWLTISIWLNNLVFSVVTAPIELRYQLFSLIITFCFVILFIAFLSKQSSLKNTRTIQIKDLAITP